MSEETNIRGYQFDDISFRSYPVGPDTWKDEDRSFEAVLATENQVLVRDMRARRIVQEVLRMDGFVAPRDHRLPLQDSHNRNSVRHTLGSTTNIRVEGGQLVGRNSISSAEERVATKVKEGHIRDNSIGYVVLDREIIEPGMEREVGGLTYRAGEIPLQVATRWTPMENSLTPVGADDAAKFRSSVWFQSEEKEMAREDRQETLPPQEKPEETPAATVGTSTEDPAVEAKPEPSRRELLEEITPRGFEDVLVKAIIEGLGVDEYRALLLEKHAEKCAPVGTPEPQVETRDGLENVSDAEFLRAF